MTYFGVLVLFLNALTDIANRKSEKIHAVIFGCYFFFTCIDISRYLCSKKKNIAWIVYGVVQRLL